MDSDKTEFSDTNLPELLDIQHKQHLSRVEKRTYERSGWTINWILQHQLTVPEITPCGESSHFQLAREPRNPMKGLINIQNDDTKCLRWRLIRYLNPINKNLEKK